MFNSDRQIYWLRSEYLVRPIIEIKITQSYAENRSTPTPPLRCTHYGSNTSFPLPLLTRLWGFPRFKHPSDLQTLVRTGLWSLGNAENSNIRWPSGHEPADSDPLWVRYAIEDMLDSVRTEYGPIKG